MYIIKSYEDHLGDHFIVFKDDAFDGLQPGNTADANKIINEIRLEFRRLEMKVIYFNTDLSA